MYSRMDSRRAHTLKLYKQALASAGCASEENLGHFKKYFEIMFSWHIRNTLFNQEHNEGPISIRWRCFPLLFLRLNTLVAVNATYVDSAEMFPLPFLRLNTLGAVNATCIDSAEMFPPSFPSVEHIRRCQRNLYRLGGDVSPFFSFGWTH